MSYICIGSPWPGDTLDRNSNVSVCGSADAGGAVGAVVVVSVLDNTGACIAGASQYFASADLLAWGLTIDKSYFAAQDYYNCSIVVQLQIDPTTPDATETLEGVNLVDAGGGGSLTGMP